ncbi:apolipoprotein D-like [Panonychus citri]|uniref:apolipoprotein D-like n=1 Tax=Panonychus citri TaxID=50023 RepID=UPI0023071CF8|nr:apolipoprotein D-like [Panonychus citri]
MKLIVISAIFCFLSSTSYGQRFVPGACPVVDPPESFDKRKFFGHWIETEKTPSMFDLMMRCMTVEYADDKDGSIDVSIKGVSLGGIPVSITGDGLIQDVSRAGFYNVRYGLGMPMQGTQVTIVDTDYSEYALIYSCTNSLLSGLFHSEYIWLLSRDGTLSNPTRQNIYEKLDNLKINRSGLQLSDRTGCASNVTREGDGDLASIQTTQLPIAQ